MKPPKLKIRIDTSFERSLVIQILDQDPRFTFGNLNGNPHFFFSKNGFRVDTANAPNLFPSGIYLRGNFTESDWCVQRMSFSTNTERDQYAARMIEALKDWAENAPHFANDKAGGTTTQEPLPSNIYSFPLDGSSKSKLKIRIEPFECSVVAQILDQDKRFVGVLCSAKYFVSNGFQVISLNWPWLELDKCGLRGGTSASDFRPCSLKVASNADRDAYIQRLISALDDWSKNAPEFAGDQHQTLYTVEPGGIHTFY